MAGWILWLLAACLLGLGELHSGGFYLLPFALGAALAAIVTLLGVGALLSGLVFITASGIVVLTLRTGAAALVGRRAMVLERIANDEGVGCVRIEGGEVWTARSFDDDEVIEAGDRVEVVEIRGATAFVMH
jgi:membrane protein implicated in regulation of membrane protease activity